MPAIGERIEKLKQGITLYARRGDIAAGAAAVELATSLGILISRAGETGDPPKLVAVAGAAAFGGVLFSLGVGLHAASKRSNLGGELTDVVLKQAVGDLKPEAFQASWGALQQLDVALKRANHESKRLASFATIYDAFTQRAQQEDNSALGK